MCHYSMYYLLRRACPEKLLLFYSFIWHGSLLTHIIAQFTFLTIPSTLTHILSFQYLHSPTIIFFPSGSSAHISISVLEFQYLPTSVTSCLNRKFGSSYRYPDLDNILLYIALYIYQTHL